MSPENINGVNNVEPIKIIVMILNTFLKSCICVFMASIITCILKRKYMEKTIYKINNKYLNIDLEYLFKNSFYSLFSYIISIFSTLLITYIIANNIDEYQVGVYRYIFSWYGVIASLMLSGISTSLMISIANGYNSLKQALRYKTYFSSIGIIFTIVISSYYLYKSNIVLAVGFLILAISIPLIEISGLYTSYLQGKKDFKNSSKFITISKISNLIFLTVFIFIFNFRDSNTILISSLFCVGIIQSVYSIYLYKNRHERKLTGHEKKDNGLIRYSIHLTLMGIIFTLGQQADKLILFTVFGSGALAYYWIITTIPLEAQRFISQIISIYIPKMVKSDHNDKSFRKKIIKLIFISSLILLLLSCTYYITSPLVFKILFPAYIKYVFLSKIFFFNIIFIPFLFLWSFFLAKNDLKKSYLFHILDPILQISLYLIFVYLFKLDVIGLVYAVLFKNTIMSIVGLSLFIKTKK